MSIPLWAGLTSQCTTAGPRVWTHPSIKAARNIATVRTPAAPGHTYEIIAIKAIRKLVNPHSVQNMINLAKL